MNTPEAVRKPRLAAVLGGPGSVRRGLGTVALASVAALALLLGGLVAAAVLWAAATAVAVHAWFLARQRAARAAAGDAQGQGWDTRAEPLPAELTAALMLRLNDAARIWTANLGTAQGQLRDATNQLLGSFDDILLRLDALIGHDSAGAEAHDDGRVAVLAACEEQLRQLLRNFDGFVRSRDEVLHSVRSLTEASGSLQTMAEDVSKLARQTSLLSINAAIEAARAGPSGRGFAVVAGEVRRLSAESGETGRRIGSQVSEFSSCMQQALAQARRSAQTDREAIEASESTISQVVQQVDDAVTQLNARAAEQTAEGERVKEQVQQLLIAFQFQDRVHQIMDQLRASMLAAVESIQQSLREGRVPDPEAWKALLGTGYTTAEQRAVARGEAVATKPQATIETTFF